MDTVHYMHTIAAVSHTENEVNGSAEGEAAAACGRSEVDYIFNVRQDPLMQFPQLHEHSF